MDKSWKSRGKVMEKSCKTNGKVMQSSRRIEDDKLLLGLWENGKQTLWAHGKLDLLEVDKELLEDECDEHSISVFHTHSISVFHTQHLSC